MAAEAPSFALGEQASGGSLVAQFGKKGLYRLTASGNAEAAFLVEWARVVEALDYATTRRPVLQARAGGVSTPREGEKKDGDPPDGEDDARTLSVFL